MYRTTTSITLPKQRNDRANLCAIGVLDEENHSRICSSCFIQLDKHAYRCEVVTATCYVNGDLRNYHFTVTIEH